VEDLQLKLATTEKDKMEEERLRNYFQLERDKVASFWEITKKELEDRR
jgi:growth arrest-specific protein 8